MAGTARKINPAATDTHNVELRKRNQIAHISQRKITPEQEQEIIKLLADKHLGCDIAGKYNVSPKTITIIKQKNIEQIKKIEEANSEALRAYLKVKAIGKCNEIMDCITSKKIQSSNMLSMTLAIKNLLEVYEGRNKNDSNVNVNIDLGSIMDRAERACKGQTMDADADIVHTAIVKPDNDNDNK